MVGRVLLLLLIALGLPSPAGAGLPGWRWPVDGPVLARFTDAGSPFAAGRPRGIDIAARPGSPVRAACTGRVRFAGVAGPSGRTVTLACGALATTYLHLSAIGV